MFAKRLRAAFFYGSSILMMLGSLACGSPHQDSPRPRMSTRLLLRWGVWMAYSEWRPDQPHEDWSGSLSIEGGTMRDPRLVIYHGSWGPQRRVYVPLDRPEWKSPHLDFVRPLWGYKGLEGLLVDVEGGERSLLRFRSAMLNVEFRLGDIPEGGQLAWPAGSKYGHSELVACRLEDEGVYWNNLTARQEEARTGKKRVELGLNLFRGDYLRRELHHRLGAWIPPGGTVEIPLTWDRPGTAVATWRFAGTTWAPGPDTMNELYAGSSSPLVKITTRLDGKPLSGASYKAKFMRGANSALEHTDELSGPFSPGGHILSISNLSPDKAYVVLYGVTVRDAPKNWDVLKNCLPFQADWFDGSFPVENAGGDVPSGGRGVIVGYDTNVLAAENGWIDAAIRFQARTGAGNFILFRTETDQVSEADWRRWFKSCRENHLYFALRTQMSKPALPVDELLRLAADTGGEYFLGAKNHELSLPLYAGWNDVDFPPTRTLADVERDYLRYIRESYRVGAAPRLLGEAALFHRYDYKAGVNLILSETMTGNTSLLLAEARGAARAYGRDLWGMHIACHVQCTPEGWHQERMFWLNLYLGYLSGASILEDEEGALAKVHSFVSGPTDPLPSARQKIIADFFRWARRHPRSSPPAVDLGFLYGRHDAITGGMSLNTERPVRVWEGFGPAAPSWEYGRPESGWLLMDAFLPGVWLCPVLRKESGLRRWFAGTPYGQVDVVPIEADAPRLSAYKLLVFPGWHTMEPEDMKKLISYVESGGTLVLGLPHLQSSADRTKILSSTDWPFVDPGLIERLCGIRIGGPGGAARNGEALGQTWDLQDSERGLLGVADILLRGAEVVGRADGRTLVVENKLGKGRTLTFTAYEFFGHRGLETLARAWLEKLARELPSDIRLEGGDGEVSFFVYPQADGRNRVYLINTDWTTPGNEKRCRLRARSGDALDVTVREGQVTEVVM